MRLLLRRVLAARWAPVTILTNAMVQARGSRRRMLGALDPERVTMQVSLDSGTPDLHDRHRGRGSFARAREGIAVGITDPGMQVAASPLPLVTVLAVIRAALNDPERGRADALEAFRCT